MVLTTVAAALSSGSQPALPGFLEALASPLEHYGLWAIFFLVLVEDFGIPVPGETVIIAASIYAGSGRLNVVAVGLVAFFAAVFGDNIGYGIGRFGGRRLVDRWGKYVFLTPERLDKAEEFFDRQGAKIITIARFIEGLRQANGIIAGITKMHWLRFIAYNALGAGLWVGTWVSIGYFAGQHINTIYGVITQYSLYVAIAAVVVIVGLIARHVIRKRRKAVRPTGSPAADGGAGPDAGMAAGPDGGAGPDGASAPAAASAPAGDDDDGQAVDAHVTDADAATGGGDATAIHATGSGGEVGDASEGVGAGGNAESELSAAADSPNADHDGDADAATDSESSDNAGPPKRDT